MTDRPPSPPTPLSASPIAETDREDSVLATTSRLNETIENALGFRLDESALEEFLFELDRHDYLEWVTVTRRGEYVWDLSDSPERIADAVADALIDRVQSWLENDSEG
ncbi:hypothetical protein [Natrinema halophilum]|uniref:Uncharacterized protein n=1 Tax=Natrinema halophilum TaxID=1699371 RepID=A0A7D5H4S3_9EURY|nr:hypothetical protein [Natrinema halophilum]QLG47515.1 hypothetical protein HYG82_00970 [Natrinema halophilum]